MMLMKSGIYLIQLGSKNLAHHILGCDLEFPPMDFWIWPYIEGVGEDVVVLFYRRDLSRHWSMWTAIDGLDRLRPLPTAESRGGTFTMGRGDGPDPW